MIEVSTLLFTSSLILTKNAPKLLPLRVATTFSLFPIVCHVTKSGCSLLPPINAAKCLSDAASTSMSHRGKDDVVRHCDVLLNSSSQETRKQQKASKDLGSFRSNRKAVEILRSDLSPVFLFFLANCDRKVGPA